MHTARLFRLLYLLLEQDGLTAPQLAARLEVSARTVYRDIEALSQAGIPVYCRRGKGGGVHLMPGFAVSRAMLSSTEQREVLAALRALSAAGQTGSDATLSKLAALFRPNQAAASWVAVDFADWGQVNAQAFDTLKAAVLEKRLLSFRYFGTSGGAEARTVEPLQLWFKHRTWYLRAWCRTRGAPRLFKVSRMRGLALLDEHFTRIFDPGDFQDKAVAPGAPVVDIKLHIAAAAAHRVWDEFAESGITPQADGSFVVTARYIYEEWVLGYLLSFGPQARVLEPAWLAGRVADHAKNILERYET